MKRYLEIALVCVATIAIVDRVSVVRSIVYKAA